MIKVIIKRKVPEDKLPELISLLKKIRSITMNQPGYISGETLKRVDKPDENLVISTWQTIEDWNAWFHNEERNVIQREIDILLGKETEFEIYSYG